MTLKMDLNSIKIYIAIVSVALLVCIGICISKTVDYKIRESWPVANASVSDVASREKEVSDRDEEGRRIGSHTETYYSYSYSFIVKDITYKGSVVNAYSRPGDSIAIRYNPSNPREHLRENNFLIPIGMYMLVLMLVIVEFVLFVFYKKEKDKTILSACKPVDDIEFIHFGNH